MTTNMEAIELPCVKLLLTACMPTCATQSQWAWTCTVQQVC